MPSQKSLDLPFLSSVIQELGVRVPLTSNVPGIGEEYIQLIKNKQVKNVKSFVESLFRIISIFIIQIGQFHNFSVYLNRFIAYSFADRPNYLFKDFF